MHDLEAKMISYGAIDTEIESVFIDEWFENITITYIGMNDIGKVVCNFINCFEISLKHDKTYGKNKKTDGSLDYKYFIQNVEVIEDGEFYIFNISAWPLDGQIVCKKIDIAICSD